MVNYNDSKIYKIVDNTTGKFYIGSTSLKYLSQRLQKHISYFKENKKCCKSYDIINNNDFKIELIEMFPCNNIYELRKREGEIIKENINNILCVNKRIETGLKQNGNENYNKEYGLIYRENYKEKIKQYRQDNKDKIKQYKQDNKEKIKQYNQDNKDRANELRRLKRLYIKIDNIFKM